MASSALANNQDTNQLHHRAHALSQPSAPLDYSHQPLPEVESLGAKPASKSSLGKTGDGVVFKIPATRDMISSLFDPRLPKSHFDIFTLTILTIQLLPLLLFDRRTLQGFYLILFLLWRLSYNVGLGWVLKRQSESRFLVRLCDSLGLFDPEHHPQLSRWLKLQLESKLSNPEKGAYKADSAPLDYNVWLLFRQLVDIILLSDFLSYFCLSFCCLKLPPHAHSWLKCLTRWAAGTLLVGFNVWVKVDAHRIVHDFAWYWGDAFFLSIGDQLVFDGVFEMAPHPMYSIGYAGFYGASLITGSKLVFFVSLLAHLCQFGFLIYFENPHIERTYGPRAGPLTTRPHTKTPLKTPISTSSPPDLVVLDHELCSTPQNVSRLSRPTRQELERCLFRKRDMIGLQNFDSFRAIDLATVLLLFYSSLLLINNNKYLSLLHAMLWRVWLTFGLGSRLNNQSESKSIVLHFLTHYPFYSISNEESKKELIEDSFSNWKSTYNMSLMMTYASFAVMSIKFYSLDENWDLSSELVRHTFALCLIGLHGWAAFSTYEVLGKFGWFYGDFFIDDYPGELTYGGIYRFLNNPERSMGGAGFIGMSVMSGDKTVVAMALFSILSHWWFLSKVESPHMKKVYGDQVRKEAGLMKVLKQNAQRLKSKSRRSGSSRPGSDANAEVDSKKSPSLVAGDSEGDAKGLEQRFKEVQGTFEFIYDEALQAVDEFLEKSAPRLSGVVKDTKVLLQRSGERLTMTRVASDLSRYDTSRYKLEIQESQYHSPRDPQTGLLKFHMGEPIRLHWAAPSNHSRADWIGCYRKGSNKSSLVTEVSSMGRWFGLCYNDWEGDIFIGKKNVADALAEGSVDGIAEFRAHRLPWTEGVYEFRYHHDGKHNVMATTQLADIYVEKISAESLDVTQMEDKIRQLVGYGLGLDPQLIPKKLLRNIEGLEREGKLPDSHSEEDEDRFTIMSLDEAKRIKRLIEIGLGIELGIEILIEDGDIQKLTRRILFVQSLLKPFMDQAHHSNNLR